MVSQWFCVIPTSKRRCLKNSPNDHDTRPIRYRVGIHVDSTPTSHSHTPSVPQAEWEAAKLDGLRRFPPMRVLGVGRSRALSLVCEVALNLSKKTGIGQA